MTRSFVLASRLQFLQAWKMNPAGSLLFVTIMASAPFRYAQWLRTRRGTAVRSTLSFETGWLVAIAGVMMLSWLSKIFL